MRMNQKGRVEREGLRVWEDRSMAPRPVKSHTKSRPTLEGAGVRLRRAFGFGSTTETDPFLLFDDFRGDAPADYAAGFPWHPHRGIETVTYVLAGTVEHRDSLGNRGALGAGDVQWMTAGSGILHQEMPKGNAGGRMHGFQLWVNLPASLKMTAPRYQDIRAAEIPEVTEGDGTRVRVVCGSHRGRTGPVEGIAAEPVYLDVTMPAATRKALPVGAGRHAFAYVFEGGGTFAPGVEAENRSLLLFGDGDEVVVEAGANGIRFLLASGKPLGEPVAWHGPIVMNTEAELKQAIAELENGTFLKTPGTPG
jgi:hypothetical protein